MIENGELKTGDKILIKGPTTGEQTLTVDEMFVNDKNAVSAKTGDFVSIKLPFRIRLSDKLFLLK